MMASSRRALGGRMTRFRRQLVRVVKLWLPSASRRGGKNSNLTSVSLSAAPSTSLHLIYHTLECCQGLFSLSHLLQLLQESSDLAFSANLFCSLGGFIHGDSTPQHDILDARATRPHTQW